MYERRGRERGAEQKSNANDWMRTSHKYIVGYILCSASKQMQNAFLCLRFKLFLNAFGIEIEG